MLLGIITSSAFGNPQLIDAAGITLQDALLEIAGIRAGVVFCILKGHGVAFAVAVAAFFFFLPSFRGPALQEVIEPVTPTVVEELFQDRFNNRFRKWSVGFFFPRAIMREVMCGPVVRIEETGQSAVATGGHEGDHLRGGEDVLFFYFQRFFVYVIVHAIPVLAVAQVAYFLIQMHKGSGYPKTIATGDDEVVDVCFLVGKAFRE